jgi:hypothetical protein
MRRLVMAALLAAAAAATPAAANVLVVRSSGPSASAYPAGRSLADNARIQLRAGDTLVLLGASGTRTFRGPITTAANAAVQAGTRTVDASNGRRARIGAVRSAGIVPVSPTTIWQIDVTQGGNMCLADTSGVMLWRPDATQATTLSISGPAGTQAVSWPAGHATVEWPAGLPLADDADYQLQQTGVAVPTRIHVKALGSEPANVQAVAQALIANGCQEQLDLLVDSAPSE